MFLDRQYLQAALIIIVVIFFVIQKAATADDSDYVRSVSTAVTEIDNIVNNTEDPVTYYNVEAVDFLNLSWQNIEQVSGINVEDLTNITTIDLSGNPLSSIDTLSSDTITSLKIQHGHLRKLKGLDKLKNLEKLNLSYNRHLTVFDLSHLSVKEINLSNCGVTQLTLRLLPNVTSFIAANNRIISIEEGTFGKNFLLKILDLSHNEITHIDEYSFIRNVRLKDLNLAGNDILSLDWAWPLKNVINFNVSDNNLVDFNLLYLHNVAVLDISDNFIENLPENLDRLLPNLKNLDVHSNSIRVITQLKSSVLESLHLGDCKLHEISSEAFLGTPNLRDLNLIDNKLTRLDFIQQLRNNSNVFLEGNLWDCQCNLSTKVIVVCSPSGLGYSEFCELRASGEIKEYEPWFLHAANPVFWAPPIVALCVLIGGCFGLRAYRRCKARAVDDEGNRKSMDLLQNVQNGPDRFDDELVKRILRERLSRRFPRRLSLLSESSEPSDLESP